MKARARRRGHRGALHKIDIVLLWPQDGGPEFNKDNLARGFPDRSLR